MPRIPDPPITNNVELDSWLSYLTKELRLSSYVNALNYQVNEVDGVTTTYSGSGSYVIGFTSGICTSFSGTATPSAPEYQEHALDEDAGGGTAVTCTHGMTISSGDLILAFVNVNANPTVTDNNGANNFTKIDDFEASTTGMVSCWYRVAGASEPSSYAFTLNASQPWHLTIVRVTGADTSDPVGNDGEYYAYSSDIESPCVLATTNSLVFCGASINDDDAHSNLQSNSAWVTEWLSDTGADNLISYGYWQQNGADYTARANYTYDGGEIQSVAFVFVVNS